MSTTAATEAFTTSFTEGDIIYYRILGVLSIFCLLFGTIGNLITLAYFVRKAQHSANRYIFILISLTDILISLHCLFTGLHNLVSERTAFKNSIFCVGSGMLFGTLARYSIFLIAIISFSRCYSLVKPVKPLSPPTLLIPCAVYLIILLVQSTVPFWFGQTYHFDAYTGACMWYLSDIADSDTPVFMLLYLFTVILEYTLPIIPVVISCAVILYKLQSGIKPTKAKASASVTVLILSAVYIFYNLPVLTFYIIDFIGYLRNPNYASVALANKGILYSYIIAAAYFVPLNSTTNVIVYIIRLRAVRQCITHPIRNLFMSIRTTVSESASLKMRYQYDSLNNAILTQSKL